MSNTARRRAHPITDEDLGKWVKSAEAILTKVKGGRDIEIIFRELTDAEEAFRTLPIELELTYAVRRALCLYFYFSDTLTERSGLRQEIADLKAKGLAAISPTISARAKFISAFSFFVMGSSLVSACDKFLRGKDQSKLAQLGTDDFKLETGNGPGKDLTYALSYFVDALETVTGEGKLVQTTGDLILVSRSFWAAVAKKAAVVAKEAAPDQLTLVEQTTFKYNKFVVHGLSTEDAKETKVISWAPVRPEEVVGDPDVTIILRRMCDRLAMYDPIQQKNPFVEYGGLVESILIDGPPGTGKTTRQRMMWTRLEMRAEQVGLAFLPSTLTADQVKSEWYGKTAMLIAQTKENIMDPSRLAMWSLDDIDLLMSDRDSPGTGGADKDLLKGLMDFFSGATSKFTGNYISVAATNKPTGLDDALRQRFVYRAVIQGAKTSEDYTDLIFNELGGFGKTGLLQIGEGKYRAFSRVLPTAIADIYEPALKAKYAKKGGTWDDIGRLCEEFRAKDPKFTGRSVKNAIQSAVAKAADFEVPEDWFTKPEAFRSKTWEERLEMVKGLYTAVTADMIMIAIEYQYNIDRRYEEEAYAKRVKNLAEQLLIQQEAVSLAELTLKKKR